jgi:adenosylcobinamide-GDP ribazoletransferase
VNRALAAAAAALSYFTIVPIRSQSAPDGYALSFLPFIGALVGALAGGAGYATWTLTHSTLFAALTAWIVSLVASGAIHLDGFLDCCDGLLASVSAERRLEILRDPTHGTYALAGMAMLCAVWIAALASLPPSALPLALAFVEGLSRLAALVNAWRQPYARPHVSAAFSSRPNIAVTLFGAALVLALGYALHPATLLLVAGAVVVSLLIAAWMARRLGGGLTGDCYGAIVSIILVLVLLPVAAILR